MAPLEIDLPGVAEGAEVTYRGPSGSNSIDVAKGTFSRNAGGDRLTVTQGTSWALLPVYAGMQVQIMSGANAGRLLTIASISADGRTLVFAEANVVTGAAEAVEVVTQPTVPSGPKSIEVKSATFTRNAGGDTLPDEDARARAGGCSRSSWASRSR